MESFARFRHLLLRISKSLGASAFALFVLTSPANPQEAESGPRELFHQANTSYENKNYGDAEALYESALAAGLQNSSVHYNLGNCRFKQGKLGPAIASYLRAQRLDPRNVDIEHNLRYARSLQLDQEFSTPEQTFTAALFGQLRDRFTLEEHLFVVLILFWALCGVWAGRIWRPSLSFLRTSGWVLLVLYLSAVALATSKYVVLSRPLAVITFPSATVTSGPDSGTALFTLHEGTTTTVRRHHGDWVQISLPNGPTGWIEQSHLEYL